MVTRLTIANRPCIPTSVAAVLASLAMLACRLACRLYTAFTLVTSELGQTGLLLFLKAEISTTAGTFSSTSYPTNINL